MPVKTLKKRVKKSSRKPLKTKKVPPKPTKKILKRPSKKVLRQPAKKLVEKPSRKTSIKVIMKTAKKPLWVPSKDQIQNANMTRFIEFVNRRYGRNFRSYRDLYQWSVDRIPDFWAAVWDFVEIKASRKYNQVVEDLTKYPGTKWFPGARLNFAENLLRYRDDQLAFIFIGETQTSGTMTYAELYGAVSRLAKSLREIGVVPGDRVAGYMPNLMETAIAMLAATSIGAVWSSCATDIGALAALDRLGQIEPKVLFTVDGYFYKGKPFSTLGNAAEVAKAIPSLKKVVVVSYTGNKPALDSIPNAVHYDDFLAKEIELPLQFEQLPFDHPVFIMFSSGTTGKPKCLVQGTGGILLNHLKELILHTDVKREDRIFYITTCSWMMWNWLLSSLGAGATIALYDGNPNYPDAGAMWKMTQDKKISIFGLSATYINYLRSEGIQPGKKYDLSSLREISQTGSVLSSEGFEWVYREIKQNLHFNSISGGTDINGCFAIGSPIQPVFAGELQSPGLGWKVKAYDANGKPVWDEQGELVCEAPAPPMPLYFWNDPNGEKYKSAYFDTYPGVWRHGDYIIMHRDTGGITFYGRSDAVLKPSGVRIGTAEIYNVVERLEGVADSLAIGQNWEGDQRVILFVKLAPGVSLTEELQNKIRKTLREKASPRHVPSIIMEMPEAPYTMNMKKVESAVTNIIHGRPVLNRDALMNPQVLDYFEKIVPELQK
jgi:acetoacetyl-CoA synthetase